MLPELAKEEVAAALDAVALETLRAGGLAGPPVDATALAATLNVDLAWDDRLAHRARVVKPARRAGAAGSILLRPEPRGERVQWAVAHELGELLAEQVCGRLGIDPAEAAADCREQVANRLAGRLLVPTPWFVAAGECCGWDLLRLKRVFSTASHELLARRMLDRPEPTAITIFDQGRRTFRAANLPSRAPAWSTAEDACWRAVHVTGCPRHEQADGVRIDAWPVHEPHWKREIVRIEADAESNF